MTSTSIEAMLVRARAAHKLRDKGKIEAIEALVMVVMPSEEIERASMTVARQTGPSREALALSRKGRKRAPRLPKRMRDAIHSTPPRSDTVRLLDLVA
jgi:hypothetical protein